MTGTTLIRVLPVMVVGALIYILGLDLLKEAVYDTYGRVSTFEYATIWLIVRTCLYLLLSLLTTLSDSRDDHRGELDA
jgi:SulP family sulfate permease